MSYAFSVEPVVGTVPHFLIRRNNVPVACCRSYADADALAWQLERQELER